MFTLMHYMYNSTYKHDFTSTCTVYMSTIVTFCLQLSEFNLCVCDYLIILSVPTETALNNTALLIVNYEPHLTLISYCDDLLFLREEYESKVLV